MNSMTGYGRGERSNGRETFVVEVRSVNHRFLEVSVKSYRRSTQLDELIRKKIKGRFARGFFEVTVGLGEGSEKKPFFMDLGLVEQWIEGARAVKEKYDLAGELDVNTLLQVKDLFRPEEDNDFLNTHWETIERGLEEALVGLGQMREEEGRALGEDLAARADRLSSLAGEIERAQPGLVRETYEKMKEKIRKLTESEIVDPARIAQEAALYAERSDVTEEIVRIKSHLGQFRALIDGPGPVGRKLEFTLQEINREVNTVGSKAGSYDVSRQVIEMKGELEKMREQVQNIE
jgi:uncharacterized protein (TIGR00255 family)